ncbi:lipase member H-like isoform X1 [Osmia bicornis bicornis]|uniref:lipase member H-like isoform X1 n=1 Tax=Osmia bicornis bicornis TaxID=1437191 RepID=UPI001EAF816C|nr:lipase member H-like isoform X1 [Osmia bicornis bicornis]
MPRIWNYFWILLCIVVKNTVAGICDEESNPDTVAKVRLLVYNGNSSQYSFSEGKLANPEGIAKDIASNKDTVMYIHGFLENPDADNVLTIIKAYLDERDVNLIAVDWGDVAIDINYVFVSSQVTVIGKAVAEFLEKLSRVIDLNTLHVIGHSLGAHVAGQIGRSMNVTLTRITGLDPALPLFYPSTCHIRPTDAEAVVILHTDGGFYGTPVDTGTVDFYANRGAVPQPGCPKIIGSELCSHQRSVKLYAESLKNSKAFPVHKCFDKLEIGGVSKSIYFGDSTPDNIHGSYCFDTNAQAPYGKGSSI